MKHTCFALMTAVIILAGSAVQAQVNQCAKRADVLERLEIKYGETRQSIGLGSNNSVVETFASTETGSWTITVTQPNGLTCLVASGQAFETLEQVAKKTGSPV